jgi:N-acetyl-anhydromuramyl-L-alanine amidase AmpD
MIKKIITGVKSLFIKKDKVELFYPNAIKNVEGIILPIKGQYKHSYPQGAVVHYTAGRSLKDKEDAINTLKSLKSNQYCTFVIARDGTVFQNFPLSHWGQHAGSSSYKSLGEWLSNKLVGIEVCCAGKLLQGNKTYSSWFQEFYPEELVRIVSTAYLNWVPGAYLKFTPEQEKSLVDLLLWLKRNNPDVFSFDYVLGHDEIAPKRKVDPGGSLSVPMPIFRESLGRKYSMGSKNE